MELDQRQKKIVQELIKRNILVTPNILKVINSVDSDDSLSTCINKLNALKNPDEHNIMEIFDNKDSPSEKKGSGNDVGIIFSHSSDIVKKKEVRDFVQYFRNRYKSIEAILKNRPELRRTMSINRVLNKKDSEKVSIIGLISEKSITKNGNIMLTLEDPTGQIKVLINKNRPEVFENAKDCVFDEIVGAIGTNKEKLIFADNIVWPDVPIHKELKKAPDEAYAVFLSDLHVGSINFLEEKFNKFIKWLNGETGTEEHKQIVNKVKYLFIVGDLVDGVGIYPGQEEELTIPSIYEQYRYSAKLLKKIPSRIKIILCPGNHDAGRLSEPQPQISKQVAPDLYDMENVILVSNPAIVNIHKSDNFPGFDVLLYHGYSFDYYVANVDSIRNGGGYHRADLIMKFLLKRRHLSPAHSSTLYMPDTTKDPLVISTIPDFFVTGHIHYTNIANYNNITTICGSCWQSQTSFQLKVGHDPEPARVPLINLKTRKPKIMKF